MEKSLTRITGRKYAVACSNGTDALHFALISLNLKPDDEVSVTDKCKEHLRIKAAVELAKSKDQASWLEVNFDDMSGKFLSYPDRSELSSEINENLIVELYSK